MSSDDDDDVKLYNPLARRQNRRQIVVAFSSSDSDSDDGATFTPPSKKRRRGGAARWSGGSTSGSSSKETPPVPMSADRTVVVEDDDDSNGLLTAAERAREMQREMEIEWEIKQRLAQDTVLNQTRAIMSKITNVKRQIFADGSERDVISLDSDSDDGDVLEVQAVSKPVATNGHTAAAPAQDKGERITLHVRSNGERTDEMKMFSKESFDVLYTTFCEHHGLPRSAVQMFLDGEALRPSDTPHNCDLESGDLIDAKVDFSQQDSSKRKRVVRLRLVVDGRRPEVFVIDATATLEKLRASFCKKHHIADEEDVVMTVLGERIALSETIESCNLIDNDEIDVKISNFVDPAAITLSLRFDAKTTVAYNIIPTDKVEGLLHRVAADRGVRVDQVHLRLDGENMDPSRIFQYYDLEGGELIDVILR
ncbi:hypothetical protein PINS_up009209 [Pythium insidiosum]|nr:hypothetical protein PINS_up009209 [Pythium insidiosum]